MMSVHSCIRIGLRYRNLRLWLNPCNSLIHSQQIMEEVPSEWFCSGGVRTIEDVNLMLRNAERYRSFRFITCPFEGGAARFIKGLRDTNIKRLGFEKQFLQLDEIMAIVDLIKTIPLEELCLRETRIGGFRFNLIVDALSVSHLTSLILTNDEIPPSSLCHLARALRTNCTRLVKLDLSNNRIDDDAAIELASALPFATSLRTLLLKNTDLYQQRMTAFCDGISLSPHITRVAFDRNRYNAALSHQSHTTQPSRALRAMIETSKIEHLSIGCCGIYEWGELGKSIRSSLTLKTLDAINNNYGMGNNEPWREFIDEIGPHVSLREVIVGHHTFQEAIDQRLGQLHCQRSKCLQLLVSTKQLPAELIRRLGEYIPVEFDPVVHDWSLSS